MFLEDRGELRHQAKEDIVEIQRENKKGLNAKRKKTKKYKEGDLVAIRRT